jgi:nuclear protein localization family protein 4
MLGALYLRHMNAYIFCTMMMMMMMMMICYIAGELQLESAGGVEKTSFVTVKVSLDEEGNTVVEGYQVSLQCMEMVAEGVLELTANMGVCKVNPTFTAVQEGKNTNEVDNNFFLNNVPIARHESITFVATFPPLNREVMPTQEDLKRQLSK